MNNTIDINVGETGNIDFDIQEENQNIGFNSQENSNININLQDSDEVNMQVNSVNSEINFELGQQTTGTNNYKKLINQPSINNIVLIDNKTSEDLGLQPAGSYANSKISNIEIDQLFR